MTRWKRLRAGTLAFGLVAVVNAGCSSTVTLSVLPVAKTGSTEDSRLPRVGFDTLTGPPCFREELAGYLSSPGGLQLATEPGQSDLMLSGAATRIEVHSNRGDKEVLLLYFTAFIVTAPLAAILYGTVDWHADAIADGELIASDAANPVIWKQSVTVSISESQRTMPTHEALQAAMTRAVCQKLAATLLNRLTEHLANRR